MIAAFEVIRVLGVALLSAKSMQFSANMDRRFLSSQFFLKFVRNQDVRNLESQFSGMYHYVTSLWFEVLW